MNRHTVFALLLVYSFSIFSLAEIPLLKLDDAAIAQERARISSDFTKRDYLAKASYLALAGGTLWFAYKWGLFDYFKGKKPEVSIPLEVPNVVPVEQITSNNVLAMVATLYKHSENQAKKIIDQGNEIAKLKAKDAEGKMHWFIEGAKYVGVTGFSILGSIVVTSKWQKFFNYALGEPTFDWFYGSHSMLNRIDSLRFHIANSLDATGTTSQTTLDYHHNAIAPTMDTLYKNLQELIAFSEYYFDKLDPAVVAQYNLDGAPRFLFNNANDYFAALKTALDNQDRAKALALTDAFRAELTNYNKDCQSFENIVLN